MIAVDTNILVYAHRQDADFHAPAVRSLRALAEGKASWAIPWPCLHEFFAVVTHPRIYDPPSTPEQAVEQVDAWLESPTLRPLGEAVDHWQTLRTLVLDGRVRGPMIHDARVAAVCQAHGVRELWSADRDFGRFTDLVTRNPLLQRS